MHKISKALSATLAVAIMATALTSCAAPTSSTGSKSTASGGTSTPSSNQEPVTIEWLAWQPSAQPEADSEIVAMVEEMFNAKFNLWSIDDQQWDETLNVKLAGGTMPDVIRLKNIQSLPSYIKQGVVEELPLDLIKEKAPNYYKIITDADTNNSAWDATNYEGKNYGFIGISKDGEYASVLAYRQDWMENVGITKVPETLEEFEKLMYAFRNDDPDKNGKKDTYGLSNRVIRAVLGAYGVPYNEEEKALKYILKDGKPVYSVIQPEAKEALELLQKWYKDGVIDPEYITGENTGGYWGLSHAFINGKIGVSCGPFYHWNAPFSEGAKGGDNYNEVMSVNPDAKIAYGLSIVGKDGKSGMPGTGPFREPVVLTSQAMKDPRKVDTILAMLDKLYADDEYATLIRYGIEDKHFNMINGELKTAAEYKEVTNTRTLGMQVFNFLVTPPRLVAELQKPKYTWADKVAKGPFYQDIIIPTNETMGKYANTLFTFTEESYAKIITGEKPIDYFDDFVIEFNRQGGADSTTALQETYAKMKG